MAFGLDFQISSVFESEGFDKAQKAMEHMDAQGEDLGLTAGELQNRMDALNMSVGDNAQFYKEGQEGSIAFKEGLEKLGSEQAAVSAAAEEMEKSQEFVREQLQRTNMVMHENGEGAQQFRDMTTGAFTDSKDASAEMQDQLQTFEFDMLSLMFAGMAVSRALEGLVNPAMESAGVFDVISQTLEIFFLPAALLVLDNVLKMQQFFLNLPKPMQKAINMFVLAGIVLAKFAVIAGMLKLNLGPAVDFLKLFGYQIIKVASLFRNMVMVVGALSKKLAISLFTALGPVGLILGAIVLAVGAFALAWKNNFLGIRQKAGEFIKWIGNNLPKIVRFFNPILGVLDLVIKAINRLFGKDIETLGSKFDDIGDGIADMGDEMIASGDKMDELDKKADKKNPFEKMMPGNGTNSSTEAMGQDAEQSKTENNNIRNNIKVEGTKGMDEKKIAKEVDKRLGKTKKNTKRGR